jgi:hypothetical protein
MEFSGGKHSATESIDQLLRVGKASVKALSELPINVSENFDRRVQKRAGRPTNR